MNRIDQLIRCIRPGDRAAAEEAKSRWDGIAKPLGSLGTLEGMIVRIAALQESAEVRLDRRVLLVFCADHGVTAQGVSQCGSEVTARAERAGCLVVPADIGIRDFSGHPGVRNLRVRNGTGDFSRGPAMSRGECLLAMERGAELVREFAEDGTELFAVGEMGIGNTTAAAALAAALLNMPPDAVVGRGAGLGSAGLERKKAAVQRALEVNRPDPDDIPGLLAAVGGLEIAAMCGAFLAAAACRKPVIIDGVISAVAALCAVRLCPVAAEALLPSHVSAEPAGREILKALGLHAPLDAGMFLGEGAGAVMLMPLLDLALSLYRSGQDFARLGIEAYRPQK